MFRRERFGYVRRVRAPIIIRIIMERETSDKSESHKMLGYQQRREGTYVQKRYRMKKKDRTRNKRQRYVNESHEKNDRERTEYFFGITYVSGENIPTDVQADEIRRTKKGKNGMWNLKNAIGVRFCRSEREKLCGERTYRAVTVQSLQYGVVISKHYGAIFKSPLNENSARCDPQCWTKCANSKDT